MKQLVLFATLMAVALTACKPQAPGTGPSGRASGQTTATIVAKQGKRADLYIQVSALGKLDYFEDHRRGMKLAGELLGVKTEYKEQADLDIDVMTSDIDMAIARKPAGLVVVGFEDSLIPAVDRAVEAGIPVVTVDADLPGSKRVAFVGTGNYNAGYKGGEKLAELVGGKGKVAILTRFGQSNLNERVAGYKAALAKFPDIELLPLQNTESDPVRVPQIASLLLQRHADLAGIACVEATGGAGVATAIKEADRAGQVKVVAMDRDNAVLDFIGEGVIQATVVQQTALMPIYAVTILYQLNHMDAPISSDNVAAGVPGVPLTIDTGVLIVDKGNYKYFQR